MCFRVMRQNQGNILVPIVRELGGHRKDLGKKVVLLNLYFKNDLSSSSKENIAMQ